MEFLPSEIVFNIFPFLKVNELWRFIVTCRGLFELGNSTFQSRKNEANVNIFTAFGALNKKGSLYCLARANNLPEDDLVGWYVQTTKITYSMQRK
jgi:hypothetical protein